MFDLHNDFPTALKRREYAGYIAAHAGDTVTAAIWTSELGDRAAIRVASMTAALEPLGVPIAIEDIGFLSDGLDGFDFSRYFYCSLTWNHDNAFAGGALGGGRLTTLGGGRLTTLGARAIRRINGRAALDLAHISRASFYEALELAERPMCSHTAFGPHPRCLDDGQIRALIARRAPIGLFAVTSYTGARTVSELAEVIDGFVQRYGAGCLCMGTDLYGTNDLPHGFNDYGDADALREELYRLGYTDRDIDSIFFNNAKLFYEEMTHERHL